MVSGPANLDPTKLFSQLAALHPPAAETFFSGGAVGGILVDPTRPYRAAILLIANALGVPLQQDGDAYYSHGTCYAYPEGSTIPAATADDVTYGFYVFGSMLPVSLHGATGAVRFKPAGAALPYGLTVGWDVPFDCDTNGCNLSLASVGDIDKWCDQHVDGSHHHQLATSVNDTRAACRWFESSTPCYFTLALLVTD